MAPKPTVLLVDDEEAVRFPIRRFLTAAGFEVREADSVGAGIDACRTAIPAAAVLDFSLPDGDGLDLLRRLKAMDTALPVILLTGHGTIDLAVKAMQEGAEQFFTKPVELPTLRVVLERARTGAAASSRWWGARPKRATPWIPSWARARRSDGSPSRPRASPRRRFPSSSRVRPAAAKVLSRAGCTSTAHGPTSPSWT